MIVDLIKEITEKKYRNGTGSVCASAKQLNNLYELFNQFSDIDGIAVEVGVWRGGIARLMADTIDKDLYLFDTFSGIPYKSDKDNFHEIGHFKETDIEFVKEFVGNKEKVHIYQGIFPGSGDVLVGKKIAIAHIDVDMYQSYKEALEFIYPLMSKGGIIIFDDYKVESCQGATLAVDEFLSDKPEKIQLYKWQCHIVKE
jgi:O-methyltransferase